jgi:hypothetical protein
VVVEVAILESLDPSGSEGEAAQSAF